MNDATVTFAAARLRHCANRQAAAAGEVYPDRLRRYFSLAATFDARREISAWRGYQPTPLVELRGVAAEFGLGAVYYKDESGRFGLGSFKALGGAYAVLRVVQDAIFTATGARASAGDLESGDGRFRAITADITVAAATDGNHGRAVAWGASRFGCACRIYLHAGVSDARARALRELGASVTRIRGDYDESVRRAAADAAANGWHLVADTVGAGDDGDFTVPATVMTGYSVMLEEIATQAPGVLAGTEAASPTSSPSPTSPSPSSPSPGSAPSPSPPSPQLSRSPSPSPSPGPVTHVFVQGGVGGLAASVAAYLWQKCGARRPRFIVVEPALAACLFASAKRGHASAVAIAEETLMAGLSCGEASSLAWEVLAAAADDFLTIPDALVAPTMRLLAHGSPPLEAGESAIAGLAGCLAARRQPPLAAALDLNTRSRVLIIGSEGATDREIYRKFVG